jgi:hypothetical protein
MILSASSPVGLKSLNSFIKYKNTEEEGYSEISMIRGESLCWDALCPTQEEVV